jgi:hypothetical protein
MVKTHFLQKPKNKFFCQNAKKKKTIFQTQSHVLARDTHAWSIVSSSHSSTFVTTISAVC